MATFTMELKEVIESLYGTTMDADDYVQQYQSITVNTVTYGKLPVLPEYDTIGLGFYPIHNEEYRRVLNGKIIDEYYLREIGLETVEMFVLSLRRKMDQIMPYYNQLYASAEIAYGPLDTMKIHSVGTHHIENKEDVTANSSSDTNNKSGSRSVGSDFPQTMLAGNGDYARTGSDVTSESNIGSDTTNNSNSDSNTDTSKDSLVTGYQGAASDLITKYRYTFLNIDTAILADIEECFMLVTNNGDEYFASGSYWRY